KVNVQVDAGIAGIVSALSLFPQLQTIESCEASRGAPWVCFSCSNGRSWKPIAEFTLGFLAPKLFETVGDAVSIDLRPTVGGEVLADMIVRPEVLESVQAAIMTLAEEFIRDHN
ncbi:MAG: hypothetical protein ACRDHZ_27020, partial [Ktedonobacteraceae bacterium]